MHRYRVEIRLNDETVHECEETGDTPEEAVDQAWEKFDPLRSLGARQTDYNARVEEV